MASPIGPEARRSPSAALLMLLPIALAAFSISPMLATGYLADDVVSSLLPGMMRATGEGFVARTLGAIRNSIRGGRFYPMVWVEYDAAFTLLRDVVAYKAAILLGVLVDLGLLMALVRRAGGGAGLASLAALTTAGLFQFRVFFDPILSFHGLLQVVTAGMLISLIALLKALDAGGRRWLIASVGFYLACLLTYEVTYPLFLLHAALIWWRRPGLRARVFTLLPFALLAIACAGASAAVRARFPTEAYIHDVDLGPPSVAIALAKQWSAALPPERLHRRFGGDLRGRPAPVGDRPMARGGRLPRRRPPGRRGGDRGVAEESHRGRPRAGRRPGGPRGGRPGDGGAPGGPDRRQRAVSGGDRLGQGILAGLHAVLRGGPADRLGDRGPLGTARRPRSARSMGGGDDRGGPRALERPDLPGQRADGAMPGRASGRPEVQRGDGRHGGGRTTSSGGTSRPPSARACSRPSRRARACSSSTPTPTGTTPPTPPSSIGPIRIGPSRSRLGPRRSRASTPSSSATAASARRSGPSCSGGRGGDRAARLFVRHPRLGRSEGRAAFAVVDSDGAGIGPDALSAVRRGAGWALYDLGPRGIGPDPDAARVVFAPGAIAEALAAHAGLAEIDPAVDRR